MTLLHEGVSISEAAAATGLSTHSLRYYERAGLMLEPIDRATSTHRRYSEADIGWVQFLTRLRSTGMPIATIRRYTELARRGDSTVAERHQLLVDHRTAVLAQLDDIRASLAAIDIKIAIYEQLHEQLPEKEEASA
ncbi:MerR family transcriptional regulator [Microbacterium sp. 4R-513]|uniref:MerR family transcriptional regulator n=1 Tax=Microbacterium sp. 4R-513 TaxID=2567934 RepID=UPI0013E14FDA|nr:MerR family transcriptional regulator [Microbacterium sp. 4R-513]QIG38149.1 MerR family transcriptional regulator [Microbacterium sp. 4R-513]